MTPTPPAPATAEHGMTARICDFDWASTSLGSREAWPVSLRAVTGPLLDHPLSMIVLWGLELLQIYNDSYRVVVGDKHPAGLGQGAPLGWPEVWGFNAPIFRGRPDAQLSRGCLLERSDVRSHTPQGNFNVECRCAPS